MSCGRQFSYDEIVLIIEKAARTSQTIPMPDKTEMQHPLKIKELPSPKVKESERASQDTTKNNQSEKSN
jgi:hypothetical protein